MSVNKASCGLAKNSLSLIADNDAEDGVPEGNGEKNEGLGESANVTVDTPMEENAGENGDVNKSGNGDFDPDVSSDSYESDLECQECEETFKTQNELDVSTYLYHIVRGKFRQKLVVMQSIQSAIPFCRPT